MPNNKSRIRFTFLRPDGVTTGAANDFRFVIDDVDGPNNEGLSADCDSSVRFAAIVEPRDIVVDQTRPDVNAVSLVDFATGG